MSAVTPSMTALTQNNQLTWQDEWLYYLDITTNEIMRYHPVTQRRELISGEVEESIESYEWVLGDFAYLVARTVDNQTFAIHTKSRNATPIFYEYPYRPYSIPMREDKYHPIYLALAGMMLFGISVLGWGSQFKKLR